MIIVNHKSILKDMDTNSVDEWYFENPKLEDVFEKLDYDGRKVNLSEVE